MTRRVTDLLVYCGPSNRQLAGRTKDNNVVSCGSFTFDTRAEKLFPFNVAFFDNPKRIRQGWRSHFDNSVQPLDRFSGKSAL